MHLHLPSLPVALAKLADPSLRGRPAVVAGDGPRAVVVSASQEARAAGIFKGMAVAQARRVCRGVAVAPFDPARIAAAQRRVNELAHRYTPVWETARPGHVYLDMTGSERLFGMPRDSALRIAAEVASLFSLAAAVGVGPNKLVASIASRVLRTEGVCDVMSGSEAAFLAPLPVSLLPGLGEKRALVLRDWNVRSIGELRQIPEPRLLSVFGPAATTLRERALGIDPTPVLPCGVELRVARSRTLENDEMDDEILLAHLSALVEASCRELRALGRAAKKLEVRLRHSDGLEASRQTTLNPPLSWDFEVRPEAAALFLAASSRRVRVRKLEVVLSRLVPETAQLGLFGDAPARSRLIALTRALDEIRARHGFCAAGYGSALCGLAGGEDAL